LQHNAQGIYVKAVALASPFYNCESVRWAAWLPKFNLWYCLKL